MARSLCAPWLTALVLFHAPAALAGPTIPTPGVDAAHWNAERKPHDDDQGGILSTNGSYRGSHRKYAGQGGQASSPHWRRVDEGDKHAYKVKSQAGNGRSEQRILRDWAPDRHGARCFSFSIMIDPRTRRSQTNGHFFFAQIHQGVDAGVSGNPPLFLSWTGSQWELVVRTDDGRAGANLRTVIARGPMTTGQWYSFRLKAKPGLDGKAEVELWTKEHGARLSSAPWSRQSISWGSAPQNTVGYKYRTDRSPHPWDTFNWKVGIYRGSVNTADAILYMDRIRYAKSEDDL